MNLSMADEVVILRAQVDYLLERLADNPGLANKPVNWRDLTSSKAVEQWAALVPWVLWLRDHYGLQEKVPACWYMHIAIREELCALRTGWVATFQDPQARPADAVAFHDALDRVVTRIGRWDRSGCAEGRHRHAHLPVDATDQSELERAIHADLAGREP
jgi:hypothetical protein